MDSIDVVENPIQKTGDEKTVLKICKKLYNKEAKKKGYRPIIDKPVTFRTGGQVPTLVMTTYSLGGERVQFPKYRNLSIEEILNRN